MTLVQVTHDISKYCKADLFSEVGKVTPVAARFSTVGGELGSADSARLYMCEFHIVLQIVSFFK